MAAVAILGAVGAALGLPLTVSAHALAQSSDPADGSMLQQTPQSVSITFGEDPDPKLSTIRLLDSAGRAYDRGDTQAVPSDSKKLRVAMRLGAKGIYTVSWRTVSAVDGHLASGSFAFGVGVAAAPTTPPGQQAIATAPPTPVAVAGRWLLFMGIAALIGAAFIGTVAFANPPTVAVKVAAAGAALVAGGSLALSEAQRSEAGVGYGQLLTTSLGRNLIERALPLALLLAAVFVARRATGRAQRAALVMFAVGAAGALLVDVGASHAAAGPSPLGHSMLQWIHGLAASLWIGGLLTLLLAVRGAESDHKATAVRRFSTAAAVALLLVSASGLVRAAAEIGAWDRVLTTSFGVLVVVKMAITLILAGLGAINRFRNVPRARTALRGLRRVGSTEAVVGAAALLTAAALVNVAPPAYAAKAATTSAPRVVAVGSDYARSVKVRLEADPGSAGFNRFLLRVTDYDTGRPVSVDKMQLTFSLPERPNVGESSLDLAQGQDGSYRGTGPNLSLDGTWHVNVLVQRSTDSLQVPLLLSTALAPQRIDVQRQPGLPTLYTIRLAQGRSLQVYLDPGKAGANQVHATFFDAAGNELAVDKAAISMTSRGGGSAQLPIRELEPGHFVADATVSKGMYGFELIGTMGSGERLVFHLDLEVGA